MKTVVLVLITFLVIKHNDAYIANLQLNETQTLGENEEIATKMKNLADGLKENSGIEIMKDTNELPKKPVFDEMFHLLRNFLPPFVDISQEEANKRKMMGIHPNKTAIVLQHLPHAKKTHCTHNSTSKNQDYVQVWFMMHLPKKPNNHNIENWMGHFFKELLNKFEEKANTNTTFNTETSVFHKHNDTTENTFNVEKTTLSNQTDENINSSTVSNNSETSEVTVDFHEIPESGSMEETTSNDINLVNRKRKRFTNMKQANVDTLSFIKQYSFFETSHLKSKRIKRDIHYDSVPANKKEAELKYTQKNNKHKRENKLENKIGRLIDDYDNANILEHPVKLADASTAEQLQKRSSATKESPLYFVTLFTIFLKFLLTM